MRVAYSDKPRADERTADDLSGLDIAVLIPCYNEEATVAEVVAGFRQALPGAVVYVYDNNSADATRARAAAAGAVVRSEPGQGKGHVVRRMFADVDADIYVLADGDATYDASAAGRLVQTLINDRVDMVVGARRANGAQAYPRGHVFGNWLFNTLFARLFGGGFTDIFSGYRVFSRRFVKSFPALSTGFEIETELSVHARQLRIPTAEVPLEYGERPEGSDSKLRTFSDGFKILWTLMLLVKETRPLAFFSTISAILAALALAIAYPVVATYLQTGLVPRFPTAFLAMGLMVLSSISLTCGLILDSVSRGRLEQKRILYLGMSPTPPQ